MTKPRHLNSTKKHYSPASILSSNAVDQISLNTSLTTQLFSTAYSTTPTNITQIKTLQLNTPQLQFPNPLNITLHLHITLPTLKFFSLSTVLFTTPTNISQSNRPLHKTTQHNITQHNST
ncbi:hypothetical protein M758_6G040800 [Ceratodon purpureus]|nr:hypothetical protein M758_6G040800 [Ceratodon purpureus]